MKSTRRFYPAANAAECQAIGESLSINAVNHPWERRLRCIPVQTFTAKPAPPGLANLRALLDRAHCL